MGLDGYRRELSAAQLNFLQIELTNPARCPHAYLDGQKIHRFRNSAGSAPFNYY